ncbi:MAG: FliH/SctL family protein [Acidobacteria bacterium]|nr:FliH/SctL family protein [Acidobacteriota bacterium]
MSTSEVQSTERTPAPAGSMSRIFEADEASQVGMVPWMVEEVLQPGQVRFVPPPAQQKQAPEPRQDIEATISDLQARHRRELEEVIQRTRTECETRAQNLLQTEVEPWLKRMAKSIEDIATVKQRYLADSEDQLVRLAVAIARRILYREIQVDTEALFGLIHAATQRSELRELNRILLNPKDHQALLPHLERLQLPPRVEILSDNALERGALLLESTSGVLDASIQAQLDEVERGFIDLLGRRA